MKFLNTKVKKVHNHICAVKVFQNSVHGWRMIIMSHKLCCLYSSIWREVSEIYNQNYILSYGSTIQAILFGVPGLGLNFSESYYKKGNDFGGGIFAWFLVTGLYIFILLWAPFMWVPIGKGIFTYLH